MKQEIFYTTAKLTNDGTTRCPTGVASPSEWPELKRHLRRNGFRIKSWYLIDDGQTWVIHNRPSLHMSRRARLIVGHRSDLATEPANNADTTTPPTDDSPRR